MDDLDDGSADQHLTIRQVASWLGVSTKTVRRRLAEGEFDGATKRQGPSGPEWVIPRRAVEDVPSSEHAPRIGPAPDIHDDTDDVAAAWRSRALAAESLARDQADALERLRAEHKAAPVTGPRPSTVYSLPPAPVRRLDPIEAPPARRLGAAWRVTAVVCLAVLAFAAGQWGAQGSGDERAAGRDQSATETDDDAETDDTAPDTTAAAAAPVADPSPTTQAPGPTSASPSSSPERIGPPATGPPSAQPAAPEAAAADPATESHSGRAPNAEPAGDVAEPRPTTTTVEAGASFWSVAADQVSMSLGRTATDTEITPYWAALVAANGDGLPDPGNPDLVYPGTVLRLPPP